MSQLYRIFIILLLFSQIIISQDISVYQQMGNQQEQNLTPQPGHSYVTTKFKNGKTEVLDINHNEQIELIIEFKETPLLIAKYSQNNLNKILFSEEQYSSRFSQFSNDLIRLEQVYSKVNSITQNRSQISREFHKTFFGMSVTTSKGLMNSISNLPYVKRVHINKKVESYLENSVPLINADSVWMQFNTKGDSIKIAIIDSGIDYLHPALGNGIGEGYKVIGGYDFYNNDNDPMDDYGHGTHVAGIVAANSDSIKGVAPNANLIALKVLSSQGFGMEDDIIAAIEYCADPNNDGEIDDRVDVANLSLGSSGGNPNDAVSITLDNTSKLGIVFCVAAGNSGAYNSIGSPGTAREAITVGASDNDDQLAMFSSKGPNSEISSIKPEVVAPGVMINSLEVGGGYVSHSGTSMAAPHVAGVCALLKSLYPDWGPREIKSALMTTALDLGEEVMAQGSGRVDALASAKVKTSLYPSHLSFGLVDTDFDTWIISDTITVKNYSENSQNYNIEISDFNTAGAEVEITPTIFSIPPGDSTTIVAKLSINNTIVPYPKNPSMSFSGKLRMISEEDSLSIPMGFTKASKIKFVADFPSYLLYIFNNDYIQLIFSLEYEKEIIIAPGDYEIYSYSMFETDSISKIVTLGFENQNIIGHTVIDLNFNDANNVVTFNGVDENGVNLNRAAIHTIEMPEGSAILGTAFFGIQNQLRVFSDYSDRYKFTFMEAATNIATDNKVRIIDHGKFHGIDQTYTLTNSPNDFLAADIQLQIEPSAKYVSSTPAFSLRDYFFLGFAENKSYVGNETWDGTILMSKSYEGKGIASTVLKTETTSSYLSGISYQTPFFFIENNSIVLSSQQEISYANKLPNRDSTLTFGLNPRYFNANFVNNKYTENVVFFPEYYRARNSRDFAFANVSEFSLYNSDSILILNGPILDYWAMKLNNAEYIVEVENKNYKFKELNGIAKYSSSFDLNNYDAIPPSITSLQCLNQNNVLKDSFQKNDSIHVYFSGADFDYLIEEFSRAKIYKQIDTSNTVFSAKVYGQNEWINFNLEPIAEDSIMGLLFKADLSIFMSLDSVAIDFKIEFADEVGNKSSWLLSPAIILGEGPAITDVNLFSGETIPKKYELGYNYPNPFNPSTKIEYRLKNKSFVSLFVYNILGERVKTLVKKEQKSGNYLVEFDGHGLSSGVYFYTIKANEFIKTKKMLLMK